VDHGGAAIKLRRDGGRGARRGLAAQHGRVETHGEPRVAELLARAWRAAASEDARDVLTHGFHAYPARAHPLLVRVLVRELSQPGELVVDPFCGGGTTLIEAAAAGRRSFGGDVNGVAVRLARLKTLRTTPTFRASLAGAAQRIAARAPAAARDAGVPPAALRDDFAPHVARELDALGRAIDREEDPVRHGALLLVLSSLLTKVSRREAETSERVRERPLARGFVARLFAARAGELASGLAALAAAQHAARPGARGAAPLVALANARALPLRSASATLVVTSPPYLGTYDYGRIQALRARLLGIGLAAAVRREIGGRGAAATAPDRALATFRSEFAAALREVARVLAADGVAVVIVGDSRVGTQPIRADRLVEEAAGASGLRVVAVASQERPDHAGEGAARFEGGRREHLIALAAALHPPFRSR